MSNACASTGSRTSFWQDASSLHSAAITAKHEPHDSLNYLTPTEYARRAGGGKNPDHVRLENDAAVFHFPTATTAAD